MVQFITGCGSLFNSIFTAVCQIEFFMFLFGFMIIFNVGFGLFFLFSRGLKRM